MKLITYSPIARPVTIFNQLDRWFDNIASDLPSIWKPSFEVLDMDSSYRVRAELPGMDKKDVNIEIKNHSSADIVLENHSDYTFENNADIFTIKGLNSIILKTKVGKRKIEDHLNFKVLNGIIAPKEYLKIKLATGI